MSGGNHLTYPIRIFKYEKAALQAIAAQRGTTPHSLVLAAVRRIIAEAQEAKVI